MKKVQESLQDEIKTCGICLEVMQTPGFLDGCTHVYCYSCIRQWQLVHDIQIDSRCPQCRQIFLRVTYLHARKETISRDQLRALPQYQQLESLLRQLLLPGRRVQVIL